MADGSQGQRCLWRCKRGFLTLVGVDFVFLDQVLLDLEWPKDPVHRPTLTQHGSLIVNVGPNATARGPDQLDGDETVNIGFDAASNEVLVSGFGVIERVPVADVDRISSTRGKVTTRST